MDAIAGFKGPEIGKAAFFAFLMCGFLGPVPDAAGDMMSIICNNQVVSVGDRKGEVTAKCGNPLSKSQDTANVHASQIVQKKQTGKKKADKGDQYKVTVKKKTIKERGETWTYNIDGSYRFFIFKEGRLASIEAGGLVK
jgi:hypothetical protein